MEQQLLTEILAGGSAATLAIVLLAWHRCEKNHRALREMLRELINKKADR